MPPVWITAILPLSRCQKNQLSAASWGSSYKRLGWDQVIVTASEWMSYRCLWWLVGSPVA
jgi:hypothetical protein